MKILILLQIVQICLCATVSRFIAIPYKTYWLYFHYQRQRYFKMEKLFPCHSDEGNPLRLVNVTIRSEKNFLILNGHIEVTETVRGPLELALKGEKCDMDNSRCIAFSPFGVGDMCKEFTNENNIFGKKFLPNFSPTLRCPLKTGLYEMGNVTADVREFAKLPLEGSRLKPTFIVYQKYQDGKKKLVACTNAVLSVTMSSARRSWIKFLYYRWNFIYFHQW